MIAINNFSAFFLLMCFDFSLVSGTLSQKHITAQKHHELESCCTLADTIRYNGFSLIVQTTFLKDSVLNVEKHLFSPIVIKQRLFFKKERSVLKVRENQSKKIYQRNSKGKKVLMLSNVYNAVYIIKGKFKAVFAVSGNGGCNSCEETLDYYTLDGRLAYDKNSYKDWFRFSKEYGLSDSKSHQSEVLIYPPAKSKYSQCK